MAQHCKTNASSDRGLQQGMHKNQLQELAQRSCFNLPSYSCIREGPDHAPRFKATVNFNGETFESPNYCTTLRQAEHAAAEVALNTLCKRGPSQMLAARILDETGVCKNLLQETAQRAGVSLPVYTTVRVGPGHVPVFKCIVEVGGRIFVGELAKTKKQAEKNAAMAAWSAIKQLPLLGDSDAAHEEADRSSSSGSNALTLYGGGRESSKGYGASLFHSHRSRARGGASRSRLKRDGSPAGSSGPQFYRGNGVGASAAIGAEMGLLDGGTHGRLMFNQNQSHEVVGSKGNDALRTLLQQQQQHHHHHRSHPSAVSGVSSPSLLSRDAPSWATGGGSPTLGGGSCFSSPMQHHQKSRLSWQSRSDRYELRRPDLMEELQLLRREDDDWLRAEDHNQLYLQQQQQQLQAQQQHQQQQQQQLSSGNALLQRRRPMFQSQSERFELRQTLLDELYQREEEEWLRAEVRSPRLVDRDRMPIDYRNTPYSLFSDGSSKPYGEFNDCETSYRSEYCNGTQSYNSCYGDSSNASFTASFSSNPSVISSHGARYNGSFNSVDGPGAIGSPYPLQLNETQQMGFSSAVERPSATNNYSSIGETGKPLACYVVGGGYGTGGGYDVINADTKASSITSTIACAPSNAAAAPSSSSSSSSSSSASSLWSRSAHWWGSHRPSSPSSAAAAVAHSFLGLGNMRPASSLAPPVRVRHMVAVCSAPPPRCNSSNVTAPSSSDASIALPHHRPHRDIPDRGESSTLQLLEQLRL